MRRQRQKLQVSTFPFLAVLLAAMGSLILLLLVMDRRAKIVARTKARELLAAREGRNAEAEEKRRLDWEQRRAALHAHLAAQVQDLVGRQAKERGQSEQLAGRIRLEHARLQAVQEQIAKEKTELAKGYQTLQQRETLLEKKDGKALEFLAERERLAGQLAQLEAAWRDLQLLKGKEQNTFSLVAYRGKRGENRKPIYVECRAEGVIFHPTGMRLIGPTLTDESFRHEVKTQGATLEESAKDEPRGRKRPPAPLTGPYVLFLVRPDAIETYYQVATALRGYKIDFGYELIERYWVLDFPSQTADQRSAVGGQRSGIGQGSGVGGQGSAVGEQGSERSVVSGQPSGIGKGSEIRGQGSAVGEQGSGFAGRASATGGQESGVRGQGSGVAGQGSTGESGGEELAWRPQGSGSGASNARIGGQSAGGEMNSGGGERAGFGGMYAGGPAGEMRTGFGSTIPPALLVGKRVGFPSTKFGTPQPGSFASGPSGEGRVGPSGGISWSGQESNGRPLGGPPTPSSVSSSDTGAPQSSGDSRDGPSRPDQATGQGGRGSGAGGKPGATSSQAAARPSDGQSGGAEEPADPTEAPNSRKPRLNVGGGRPGGGESDPFNRLPSPEFPQKTPAAAKPASPVRARGTRDFVINIECYEDSCAVYPGGRVFAALGGADKDAQALANYVQQLIARRQASVRTGEPPYRPQLRFQVQPDGLRTYFRVFPVLETLRLPMSRENVSE